MTNSPPILSYAAQQAPHVIRARQCLFCWELLNSLAAIPCAIIAFFGLLAFGSGEEAAMIAAAIGAAFAGAACGFLWFGRQCRRCRNQIAKGDPRGASRAITLNRVAQVVVICLATFVAACGVYQTLRAGNAIRNLRDFTLGLIPLIVLAILLAASLRVFSRAQKSLDQNAGPLPPNHPPPDPSSPSP